MPPHLSTLDLLLLVAAESEAVTPYLLSTTSGLSVGATIPALKRLASQGLLAKGQPGIRGRQEFLLTARGRQRLAQLSRLLPELPASELTETDSLSRALVLAAYCSDPKLLRTLMEKSREQRQQRLPATTRIASPTPPPPDDTVSLYRWMLAHLTAAKLQAEERQLQRIEKILAKTLKHIS